MNLLTGIDVPPMARTIWVSPEARQAWGPTIQAASLWYYAIERLTVKEGLRKCTTVHVNPNNLSASLLSFAEEGLVFLPLRRVGSYSGFAHYHPPVVDGKSWSYYGVLSCSLTSAKAFFKASDAGDHKTIGELLGYPKCCIEFFNHVWKQGYYDPIWQAATRTDGTSRSDNVVTIPNSRLWAGLRYVGIRAVPHLPCSFSCIESMRMFNAWHDASRHAGLEISSLLSMLALPVEWNCLKGIAEVTTPYFRVVTNSVPCYPKYIVKMERAK